MFGFRLARLFVAAEFCINKLVALIQDYNAHRMTIQRNCCYAALLIGEIYRHFVYVCAAYIWYMYSGKTEYITSNKPIVCQQQKQRCISKQSR